jgi:hypothetical protein
MKVKTNITAHIGVSQIGRAVMLVITYIETFKTDVSVFIVNVIMCLTSHWLSSLIMTISLCAIKEKMSILGHLKKMFWFSDNGFQKKGKVGRVFIFCFYFQSNMGRCFIFCFYFQQFKNITQTSSILLFWQTNNTIVFTLSTGLFGT